MAKRSLEQCIPQAEGEAGCPTFVGCQAIFIDVDSTLTGIEGIDELARLGGKFDTVAEMTRQAMDGVIPFENVFKARLELIRPTAKDVFQIGQRYREAIVPDAKPTIDLLHKFGKRVFLLTGGYAQAIYPLAEDLGISEERVLANTIYFDEDGTYLGFDEENPLAAQGGKGIVIAQTEQSGEWFGRTMLVGDGASEVEAMADVDLLVGFGGFVTRERVRNEADVFLGTQTFAPILPLMLGEDTLVTYDHARLGLTYDEVQFLEGAIDGLRALRFHDRAEGLACEVGALLDQRKT